VDPVKEAVDAIEDVLHEVLSNAHPEASAGVSDLQETRYLSQP
jgi:hypothetical protein